MSPALPRSTGPEDAAYDNSGAVGNSAELLASFERRSKEWVIRHAEALDCRYGPGERNRVDYFPAAAPGPVLVYIHGGYWQARRKETFRFLAAGPVARGIHVALVGYTLAPAQRLPGMEAEIRSAIDWTVRHAPEFGGDPRRILVAGWSAGGHLAALAVDHPGVIGALAISGIFDLAPIRNCNLNAALQLTEDDVARLSPIRVRLDTMKPLALAYGTEELPELQRQSADFARRRHDCGMPGEVAALEGHNHFTVLEELANPQGLITAMAARLLGVVFLILALFGGLTPAQGGVPEIARAQHEDLVALRAIIAKDRSFSPVARAEFDRQVALLDEHAGSLTPAAFELGVAAAVALADNGHTGARSAVRGMRLGAVPLRLCWLEEGLFVVRANRRYAGLAGAEVIAEEGLPPSALLAKLKRYVGGLPSMARALSPYLLQSPAAMHAAGLATEGDRLRFRFRLRDGQYAEKEVETESTPAVPVTRLDWPYRMLSSVPIPGDSRTWIQPIAGAAARVLYLSRPEEPYWDAPLPVLAGWYVQLNTTRSVGAEPLTRYLNDVMTRVRAAGIRRVMVDLRFNAGGNYQLASAFTERLPGCLPAGGWIFVVTSPNTFSAAIVIAARLKYFGGSRVLLVGEHPGDREQFWAEGGNAPLPHSRIIIRYADGYHDWGHGQPNRRFGVAAGKLDPDIPAPLAAAAYVQGRDPAVEAIKVWLKTHPL